jgi:hypothetical protein
MSKKAMKLALEALKKFVSTEWTEPFSEYRYDSDTPSENQFRDEVFTAIKALEEALAKQEQGEPFGWYDMEHGEIRDVEWNRQKPTYEGVWRPLYTTPQQRTWVGLTTGETAIIVKMLEKGNLFLAIAATEAKLKEMNK